MTAKEYLRSIRKTNTQCDRELDRLREYRERAGYGTGKKEAGRISGTNQRSRVEENVCALVDLERRLCRERRIEMIEDDLADRREEAEAIIRLIPRLQFRELLYLYYIEGLTWDQVANVMKRNMRQVFRFHGYALQAFELAQKEISKES